MDGNAIFVKGTEHALMVAVDQATQDVVHALVSRAETEAAFYQLVREAVVVAGYPQKWLRADNRRFPTFCQSPRQLSGPCPPPALPDPLLS